ncbi:Glucosylceramidase [Meloidogyne graminicola]|uniref:Glucosylceramidase n=1 Tax=Meloidogyne graminicola TaxID=189291 RepID=A0A8S9ZLJ8_9BILA|nr:Glucosylceramidase [Meloidogyne graminicola]
MLFKLVPQVKVDATVSIPPAHKSAEHIAILYCPSIFLYNNILKNILPDHYTHENDQLINFFPLSVAPYPNYEMLTKQNFYSFSKPFDVNEKDQAEICALTYVQIFCIFSFAIFPVQLLLFGRFIPPGSVRIDSQISSKFSQTNQLEFVAFRTPPNGNRVLVIISNSEENIQGIIEEEINGNKDGKKIKTIYVNIPPNSLTTIIWPKNK